MPRKHMNMPDSSKSREPLRGLTVSVTPESMLGAILESYLHRGFADRGTLRDLRPLWTVMEINEVLDVLTHDMGAVAWGWTGDNIEIKAGWWEVAYEHMPHWGDVGAFSSVESRLPEGARP